jgi:transposase
VIPMSTFLAVKALLEDSLPKKTIARRLGIDPRTVRKYAKRIASGENEPVCHRPQGKLFPYTDLIKSKVLQGLSAVQLYQDLIQDIPGLDVSYETVKRMARRFRRQEPKAFARLHFKPGEEAQIDFGEIGRIEVNGQSRRVYLFAMTLCFSRYSYYELVLDQKVPTFLGVIRRAFEDFGGVPQRIKPDNLKSAVLISKLGERYYQEDFYRLCKHYGTLPDAARPRTPTDKGRVERDIGYVKGNCFRARTFESFEAAQEYLSEWRHKIALRRVHSTTRKRPVDLFEEERKALKPLSSDPFEIATWGQYKLRKDCHIKVQGSFYSVPYQYIGQKVLVRLTQDHLTVFANNGELAKHRRALTRGQEITDPAHYPPQKRLSTQRIHQDRIDRLRGSGLHTKDYLSALKKGRWVFGDQVGRLAKLLSEYGADELDRACRRALFFNAVDGAAIVKRILLKGLQRNPLPNENICTCPVIEPYGRSLSDYQGLLEQRRVS